MTLEVIGAGYGRTGTVSLKVALEKLGFGRCYHMLEVYGDAEKQQLWARAHRGEPIDWDALFRGYRSSVDWPACNLWREQMAHFPEARVLLSLRDPDSWYESVMNTIHPSTIADLDSPDPDRRASAEWANEIVWNWVFGDRMADRAHVIGVYERHNETVMRSVPRDRLLVFEAAHGWEPLCRFLGVDVPDEAYPRLNTTEQFGQLADRSAGS